MPTQPSLPHLVRDIAAENPNAPALSGGGRRLTYGELNAAASHVAGALRRRGVGPETIVGIGLERTIEFVTAALGVLRSGGAYLPLDPSYPRERLAFMIDDASPRLVLTDALHRDSLPATAQTLLIEGAAGEDAGAPDVDIAPESLAYVIYTSGSTGTPKGVMVEHRSLQNLVSWHQQAFGVSSRDRATLLSSTSFDAAVWELWPYLARGASLHLPDDDTRQKPCALRDWLLREGITISFAATPLAEAMLDLNWPEEAPLRWLLTGADVLNRRPRPGLPFTLVNNYGPTECTVVTTSGAVAPKRDACGPPPIGAPISGVETHILDGELRPLPAGQMGEIFVGGAGLARGYLNRPDLTAERFVTSPDGTRLYRTGDTGRVRPDGSLEFAGRVDDQVKVRGYRVELGEVAWALEQHPAVASGVAAVRKQTLVAYLVLKTPLSSAELRGFLAARLPDYMLPAAFVRLDTLPLKPSGKVDRELLPEPCPELMLDAVTPAVEDGLVLQVATLVAELLGADDVGSGDNFFLLGGHSLFAAQLSARIRDTFGVELPLRTVFDAPTASGLAAAIDELLLETVESLTEDEAQSLLA